MDSFSDWLIEKVDETGELKTVGTFNGTTANFDFIKSCLQLYLDTEEGCDTDFVFTKMVSGKYLEQLQKALHLINEKAEACMDDPNTNPRVQFQIINEETNERYWIQFNADTYSTMEMLLKDEIKYEAKESKKNE